MTQEELIKAINTYHKAGNNPNKFDDEAIDVACFNRLLDLTESRNDASMTLILKTIKNYYHDGQA